MDIPNQRSTDTPLLDPARVLATIYTLGYFYIVYLLATKGIPPENKGTMDQLIGALTVIQVMIIKFYFSGSSTSEKVQAQLAVSKDRADTIIGEIAKAVPSVPVDAAALAVLKQPLPSTEGERK
jgi:hypothetical protein